MFRFKLNHDKGNETVPVPSVDEETARCIIEAMRSASHFQLFFKNPTFAKKNRYGTRDEGQAAIARVDEDENAKR